MTDNKPETPTVADRPPENAAVGIASPVACFVIAVSLLLGGSW